MVDETSLAALIAAIYEAGADFSRWPDTLSRIASAFGVPSIGMARQGETPADCWGFSSGIEPTAMESYVAYYHGINPIWHAVASTPAGTVQTDSMVVPRRNLVRTEFFNDYLAPQHIGGLLNAVVLLEDGRQTVVTLQGRHPFEKADVELYKLLTPHLQRAVQLNIKLAKAELNYAASVEIVNRLGQGVLIVDTKAKIIFANNIAETYFRPNEGLRQLDGTLCGNSVSESDAIRSAVAMCAAETQVGASKPVTVFRSDRPSLSLLVSPLNSEKFPWLGSKRPAAIIVVVDPEMSIRSQADELRRLFNLTPAEANFAIEILNADGIQAAADRLSISRATARTHLARIFEKTGTRRQAALVRLLLSATLSLQRAIGP
jgi:DNA-binding CsgD family transcriptional regulator/PAS domain-containing protein